jgi:ABC-type polysaccharide/polyol phosphate export permease
LNSLREVWRYRDLLYMLTWRDICVKYKQSVLGLCWAVLMPVVIVMAGVVVKLALAAVSGNPVTAQDIGVVSIKAVPWAFFVSSIRFSTNCLIGNSNLVTKVYFPKMILPISAVATQLFDFLIASCVLAILLPFLGFVPTLNILWVPLLVFVLVVQATGVGIFLSAAGLFYRDVKYMVELFLTFAIFFTPIFYEVSVFGAWGNVLLLNPVAPVFEGLADVATGQALPDLAWMAYSVGSAFVVFAGAIAFFKKLEPAFAETI